MKKRCLCLAFFILLSLFSPALAEDSTYEKYSIRYMDVLDTVVTLIGYAPSQEDFDIFAQDVHHLLTRYHQIFDAYHAYEGISNLYHLNAAAAAAPVHVEPELFSLLSWLKNMQPLAQGKVNAGMGALLALWHDARESGTLPDKSMLIQAREHCDFDQVILNEQSGTVYYADPQLRIDLGAVAKGYVTELLIEHMSNPLPAYILNLGGNVKCVGAPMDGRTTWSVGIQDPTDPNLYSDLLYLTDLSVVTSGDYQRFFEVDGVRYHHIIDPDTLYPSTGFRSVTIVTEDALLADFLSTALFLLSYEEGCTLLETLNSDAMAYWYFADGTIAFSDKLSPLLYTQGARSTR